MGNINFFLKDKKKKRTAIELIVRFKGERYKLGTGESVLVGFWDTDTKRCQEKREYPDHRFINPRLEQIEIYVKQLLSDYTMSGEIPTKAKFKSDYLQLIGGKKKDKHSLVQFFEDYFAGSEYEKETKKKYVTTLNWLVRYEKELRIKLYFSDINVSFYKNFRNWFFTKTYSKKVGNEYEERFYSKNYFGSLIKCLKVVMSEAGHDGEGLHDNHEFKHKKFITEAEESDSIYLTEDELAKIHAFSPTIDDLKKLTSETREHNLTRKLQSLIHVKKRFLIGCYTALRVSDFNRLGEVNVKDSFIRIKPKKGVKKNDDVIIPIHPVVREIIDSGFDFSDRVSDQKINKHIKEICQLVGIDKPISVIRTEGNKQVERIYPKWQLVTSHTARRSGATNMFKAGIPAISIMKITGHRTEKSFLKYIKITQEENAQMLANHPFFK